MDRFHTFTFEMTAASNLYDYLIDVLNNKETDDTIIRPLNNLLIRFVIAKYLILTIKEEIITKPKNSTYDNTLYFSNIESLALAVTDKQDNDKYSMNGKIFDDPNTVIAYIRNKFAHGDYVLSNDYKHIIFAPDGDKVSVEISRIEYLADHVSNVFGEYRACKEYTRGICILKRAKPIIKLFKRITDQDIDEILSEMRVFKFDLKSKDDLISKEDFVVFDCFIKTIKKSSKVLLKDNTDSIQTLINEISSTGTFNSTLDVSMTELSNDEKDYLREVFRKIYGNDVTYNDAISYLSSLTERTQISKYNNFFSNLEAFKMFKTMQIAYLLQTSDFNMISSKTEFIGKLCRTGKIEVSSDWIALSQIYMLMSISSFFENYDIQYDMFFLNKHPKTLVIKETQEEELLKKIEAWSNKIADVKKTLELKRVQLNNIEASTLDDNIKDNKKSILLSSIRNIEDLKKQTVKEIKKMRKELEKLIKDKKNNKDFYYNKYLLEYIRNSICHGNVDIIPAGTVEETIVRFRDYDKDSIVFEYELTVGEINMLFHANVMKIQLCGMVNNVIKKQL